MNLSIIIVSWNVKDKLRENLKALLASKVETRPSNSAGRHGTSNFEFEIIVVDNNSEDETVQMVKREFPNVHLLANDINMGLSKAWNMALKQIDSKYALVFNPDMIVRADTLRKMYDWMEDNRRVNVAGCKLVDEKGGLLSHVRLFPSIHDQLAIILKLPHVLKNILSKYLREDFDYTKAAQVDSIRGSFFMINMESVQELKLFINSTLPYFDERYFLWFEEVDYCKQIKKAGGEVWYTPVAECVDLVGASFKQVPRGITQRYMQDSQLKYFKKWHPTWQWLILKLVWPIGKFMAMIGEKVGIKSKAKT